MKPPSGSPTPRTASKGYDRMAPVDAGTWNRLLECYREHPANVAKASEAAGVEVRIARKAWGSGWNGSYPSIQSTLLDEEVQARARIERDGAQRAQAVRYAAIQEDVDRVKAAQAQAIKARTEEGQLVTFARANVLLCLNASSRLVSALGTVGDKVGQLVTQGNITADQYTRLLRATAMTVHASVKAGQTAMEMERLLLGEPTKILGLQGVGTTRDQAEAVRELEEVLESLKAAEEAPSRSPIAIGDAALPPGGDSP